ncbi:hypothetical protein [Bacteroides pyogenes]|uniref:hypothetical protein n=1 Tax=Bacteroides pyogenes TaxID=310300 RepID=UPI002FDACEC5
MTDKTEVQTEKEQTPPPKPDGVLTMKMEGKTFITEIFFDHDSKDTFQDKLLKVIRSEKTE